MTSHSSLFADTMGVLWGNESSSKIVSALASYVKNHRTNVENAFDVLDLLWSDNIRAMTLRQGYDAGNDRPDALWFDVAFDDDSQVLIMSERGIASSVDLVS